MLLTPLLLVTHAGEELVVDVILSQDVLLTLLRVVLDAVDDL